MLNTKYKGSIPYGFRQKYSFDVFPYISHYSHFEIVISYLNYVTPGQGNFWPQGSYLNTLGKGPLGDAT